MSKEAFQTQLEDYAKWFHQHPEASYEEYETTERIARILNDNGIEILPSGLKTGLVAQVKGSKKAEGESHVVAIRGDIDGLPITEESGVPYASVNEGYLHGCGHDYNMTVALGAALLLQRRRDQFAGTVKVIFQPAEEVSADKTLPQEPWRFCGQESLRTWKCSSARMIQTEESRENTSLALDLRAAPSISIAFASMAKARMRPMPTVVSARFVLLWL